MTDPIYDDLESLQKSKGAAAALERLIIEFSERKDYHRLFDVLLLQKRYEMGLPLARVTSLEDVPESQQQEFEDHYVAAARRVGKALLDDNNISQAWLYFRTIREPDAVATVLDKIDPKAADLQNVEELIAIALYEGAHPVKGIELMLASRGTCNTITAFDQQLQQLKPEQRTEAAAILVRHLYGDLRASVSREIERKEAAAPPEEQSLSELLKGRDWLFDDGNYHIDVSHLSSVVRFARLLEAGSPELDRAIQLAEYGSKLSSQFQYPSDPPFDEYYPAHSRFFHVLADKGRDEAIAWFRSRIDSQPDEQDQKLIAFVLTDLLLRIGRTGDAVELAEKHLSGLEDASGFSFAKLCHDAGRLDLLRRVARERGDLVGYAAALLQESRSAKAG